MSIDLISGTIVAVAVPVVPDALVAPTGLTPVVVLPVAGSPGPAAPTSHSHRVPGGSLGPPILVDGGYVVAVESNWGVTVDGAVYYDPDGAAPEEAAIASIGQAGIILTTWEG